MKIPFLDLSQQYKAIRKDVGSRLSETMKRSDYILGQEEKLFESEFAGFCESKFAVGVNSGTDALFLALLSLGIGPGDEVIVPVFTFIASAFAVSFTGAKPVFVDIDERTFNMDIGKLEAAITKNTKAIMPVHLFGQSSDMQPILTLAQKYNLKVVEDCAQSHGAKYKSSNNKWQITGSLGDVGCFSFYPTKNLGAFGDAGMIVTSNEKIYETLLMLRDCGRKSKRYEHLMIGYNSRLDTMQAAILRLKLKHLDAWNEQRRHSALIYKNELSVINGIILPFEPDFAYHVYHCFAIRINNRDKIIDNLAKEGIGSAVFYRIPLHLQKAYSGLGYKQGDFPVAEQVAQEILSLPMYPYLKDKQVKFVCRLIRETLEE